MIEFSAIPVVLYAGTEPLCNLMNFFNFITVTVFHSLIARVAEFAGLTRTSKILSYLDSLAPKYRVRLSFKFH
jgi:hypothetical protein